MAREHKRFLIVGEGIWPWYVGAASEGLKELGYEVCEFGWPLTFKEPIPGNVEPQYKSFRHRLEERAGFGPLVRKLNSDLLATAKCFRPDFIFFYNVRLISARTVKKMKDELPRSVFGQYANDNPFSENASRGYWYHFQKSLPLFDLHFAYRHENLDDFMQRGARNVNLLRAYYRKADALGAANSQLRQSDRSEVLFAGHYEPDGRLEALTAVVECGFGLRLHGGGWRSALQRLPSGHPLQRQYPAAPIVGADYRRGIAGAEVALCFLSKLNKDTYTRRNFEIPAIGTPLLSEYSEDLASLFVEGREMEFFRSMAEVPVKLMELRADPDHRARLGKAGRIRVIADGHDVLSRMKMVASTFESHRRKCSM